MARSALLLVAAAFCCCAVALPVARHWGGTGSPAAGWVSGCAVWFPDTGVRCDYHWSAGGERFTARMRGADRPDGRPATVWIDPDDPAKAVSGKSVTATAVVLGACGLLLAACSVAVTRTRRAVAFVLALAVAAVPAAAVLARAERRPGPDGVPPAAAAPLAPALRGERPVDADGPATGCPVLVADDDVVTIVSRDLRPPSTVLQPRDGPRLTVPGVASEAVLGPDGTTVAIGRTDGLVQLMDRATRRVTATLIAEGWVHSVAFAPDGAVLAVASGNTVRLWDLASMVAVATLFGRNIGLYEVGLGDGTLSVCEGGGLLRQWEI